jgi:hypothetical protein
MGSIASVEVDADRSRCTAAARPERERFDRAYEVVVDGRRDTLLADQDRLGVSAMNPFRGRRRPDRTR